MEIERRLQYRKEDQKPDILTLAQRSVDEMKKNIERMIQTFGDEKAEKIKQLMKKAKKDILTYVYEEIGDAKNAEDM